MRTSEIPGGEVTGWPHKALVIFFSNPGGGLSRCLDRRFTHVEVAVQVAVDVSGRRPVGEWISISSGSSGFCVFRGSGTASHVFRLAADLDNVSDLCWADVCLRPSGTWSFVAPFTCVEVVKRVLGLRRPFILTPAQLRRHLTKEPRHE